MTEGLRFAIVLRHRAAAGSDVAGMKTVARRSATTPCVLNGSKMWITGASVADWLRGRLRIRPRSTAA
jgi:alkylation response protein AidB-like acyl-CoA dehydrogenase